ncbi:hypothetical protein ACOSP7_002169 [Xanthoceras sorbifolium]
MSFEMGTPTWTEQSAGSWRAFVGIDAQVVSRRFLDTFKVSGVVGVMSFRFLIPAQQTGDGLLLPPVRNSKQGTSTESTCPQDITAPASSTVNRTVASTITAVAARIA